MKTEGLLERQIPVVEEICTVLRRNGSALDGSDMGVGKTYHAGGVIRHLDLPTLVVCPTVAIPGWKSMGTALGTEFDIVGYEVARVGSSPFGRWQYPRPKNLLRSYRCTSCMIEWGIDEDFPPCPHHGLGIHCVSLRTKPHKHGKFIWDENIRLLVFDEIHRCSATNTLQADMLIAARRQRIPTLGLSATVADNPMNLRAIGYLLGLHNLNDLKDIDGRTITPGFYAWAMRHGCRKMPWGGFEFAVGDERKREIQYDIGREIFPRRGVRVRKADIPGFPQTQILAELYDIDQSQKAESLFRAMDEALKSITGSDLDAPVTQFLHARQQLELLKVPIFEELYADAISQGMSVACFVNFRATLEELCKRLKTDCRVDGSQVGAKGARDREKNVQDFLNDRSRVIVATNDAGGIAISLNDIHGNFPRLGLCSLPLSAITARQVFGRLARQGSKSNALYRAILLAGTREERTHKILSGKLDRLDLLQDGDLQPENIPLTEFNSGLILRTYASQIN